MYNCSIEICVTTALIKSRLIKSVPLANYEKFFFHQTCMIVSLVK